MARKSTASAGRPQRKLKQETFMNKGTICYLCGHGGADAIDHIFPVARGGSTLDPDNLAPIHGVAGCPTCLRKCNNDKSDKLLSEIHKLKTSRDWYKGGET